MARHPLEAKPKIVEQLRNWARIARRQVNLSSASYDQEAARLYDACADWLETNEAKPLERTE
jgi:hypothetical protein